MKNFAEVKQTLHEADDPAAVWIPNEEVKRQSEIRRAEWRRRTISKEAPADSAE
jgi:hypothetical protein